jgi:hypothetical protein
MIYQAWELLLERQVIFQKYITWERRTCFCILVQTSSSSNCLLVSSPIVCVVVFLKILLILLYRLLSLSFSVKLILNGFGRRVDLTVVNHERYSVEMLFTIFSCRQLRLLWTLWGRQIFICLLPSPPTQRIAIVSLPVTNSVSRKKRS